MNYDETLKIMAVLRAAYPRYYSGQRREEVETAITLWQSIFDDLPYNVVAAAVQAFIADDDKGFPPAVGQINRRVREIVEPERMTEQEAWALVSRACENSGYHWQQEYEKLPEDIRRCVGDALTLREWALMPIEEFETVIASNFMRSYREKREIRRRREAIPPSMRELLAEWAAEQKKQLTEGQAY